MTDVDRKMAPTATASKLRIRFGSYSSFNLASVSLPIRGAMEVDGLSKGSGPPEASVILAPPESFRTRKKCEVTKNAP